MIRVTPFWKDKIIDYALRTFVNIATTTVYEATQANLNSIKLILNYRSED